MPSIGSKITYGCEHCGQPCERLGPNNWVHAGPSPQPCGGGLIRKAFASIHIEKIVGNKWHFAPPVEVPDIVEQLEHERVALLAELERSLEAWQLLVEAVRQVPSALGREPAGIYHWLIETEELIETYT